MPPTLAVRPRIGREGCGRRRSGEGHSPESPNTRTLTLSKAAILPYLATTLQASGLSRRRQSQRTILLLHSTHWLAARLPASFSPLIGLTHVKAGTPGAL